MTTTLDAADLEAGGLISEPTFLWGPGYELSARDVLNALGSYLATFGDNIGPGHVNPLDAIHAEVVHTGDITHWATGRDPADVAAIRARAEALASELFHGHFPTVRW